MIEVIPFAELGRFDNDWLSARYHFSFADYYNPRRMGLGPLRVWNDDTIRPGGGFPMHGHRDMEIITYVRRGAITHEDHLGSKGRIEAGSVQVMSAGTGIRHSEFNHEDEQTELFQIWIKPSAKDKDLEPGWATRPFPREDRAGKLVTLASGRPGDDPEALPIRQDAAMLAATLAVDQSVAHALKPGRRAYLVPPRGRLEVNGVIVDAGDGCAITQASAVTIRALDPGEVVLVDLP
ncbi:MAG: pirin family protein [Alphaproteobacteria bacterium]